MVMVGASEPQQQQVLLSWRSAVHVAYRSTDDVNKAHAACLAVAWDLVLYPLGPAEELPVACEATIYDLDFLPRGTVAGLLAEVPPGPVAVHGYNLDEETAAKLAALGVIVGRRLEANLLAGLQEAVQSSRATNPQAASAA
jgi:hypothetical protein